jgi:hypothetical protein
MITVYSVKDFDRIVKEAAQWAIEQHLDRTDSKVAINMANRFKNWTKARKQPRTADGRFQAPIFKHGINLSVHCKKCGKDSYDCQCESVPKKNKVEQNPLVSFYYPMSHLPWHTSKRLVRLISSNGTHYTGLEHQVNGGFKFKKYLVLKAYSFQVVSFNPQAMS